MRRAKDHRSREIELEMTPMIDVTFLLLVFFLCTIRFKTLEGKLSAFLPKDAGVNDRRAEIDTRVDVAIRVVDAGERRDARDASLPWGGSGRFQLVGRRLEYTVGPHRSGELDSLAERLRALRAAGADGDGDATLEPGPGTVYADVVGVLDALAGAGFTSIAFTGAVDD